MDVSRRWRAAVPILVALQEPEGSCSEEEFDAYSARRDACERIVLEGIERIDPAVEADDPQTLWGELVTDPG